MVRRLVERVAPAPGPGPTLVVAEPSGVAPRPQLVPDPVPTPAVLFRHALGAVLRGERAAQGRTLQQVARESRVSVAFVSEVERGMKQPSSEVLAALSTALHLSLSEVVSRSADLLRVPAATGAAQLRAA